MRPSPRTAQRMTAAVGTLLLLGALTACATDAAPAPEPTIAVEELARGEQAAGLEVALDGPVGVSFRRLTIPPGQGTGRHCHHGNLIAVVE